MVNGKKTKRHRCVEFADGSAESERKGGCVDRNVGGRVEGERVEERKRLAPRSAVRRDDAHNCVERKSTRQTGEIIATAWYVITYYCSASVGTMVTFEQSRRILDRPPILRLSANEPVS